jgi:hypothetical protein
MEVEALVVDHYVVSSLFVYHLGAVSKWAMDEDPLSMAINDFPKRGILVNDSETFFCG